jgi:pilus assembly protein CpaE
MVTNSVVLVGGADRKLEELLRNCGMRTPPLSAGDLNAMAEPAAKQPDVLVVDLRQTPQVPPALSVLKRHHPNTGVIIIASSLDPGLMLEAMRAGVTECLAEPLSQAELEEALARVIARRPAGPIAGQVFAFLGAKGGVGTTTVAVNVATVLAKAGGAPSTLYVDLHLANGDAAVFLGAEPRFSVVDALENTHRLDEAFFGSLVVKTKAGVDLLASSDRAMVSPVDVRRIRTLVETAARTYRFVVLDVPRSETAVLDGLEGATRIVVVTNQELSSVRSASRMAAALRQRYGKDKLQVVLSRSDRLAEIGHEDIERAVGSNVKHTIPSDYRLALSAVNRGRPLMLDNHSEVAGSLESFARALAGLGARRDKPSGLFGRLTSRK